MSVWGDVALTARASRDGLGDRLGTVDERPELAQHRDGDPLGMAQ